MQKQDLLFETGKALCKRNKPLLWGALAGTASLGLIVLVSGKDALCYLLIAGASPFVNMLVICSYLLIFLGLFALPFYICGRILLHKSKKREGPPPTGDQ